MKNILYLHTGAELYGADIVLLTLIAGLDREIYNPIVILPNNGSLVEKLREINVEVYIVDYPILRRQYFNICGIIHYLKSYFESCKSILNLIDDRSIDIIHVNTIAVLEGIYISRRINKPLIWHVHEILEKPRIVYKTTSFLIGKFSTKIVVVSQAVKAHLVDSGFIKDEKTVVIYNGVDINRFNPNTESDSLRKELNIPKDAFVIGMIGRINAIKGQDEFVGILSHLLKKYPNIYGVIAGDAFPGQEWRINHLVNLIDNSDCGNHIKYIGYRSDANALHAMFDVYMLPSVSADSLPTVVLEAMASKKVVVGYRNGGICEMVSDRNTGFLEDIKEQKKLSEDISRLIEDRELYDSMSERGYRRLNEMFSLESFNKKISGLYQGL